MTNEQPNNPLHLVILVKRSLERFDGRILLKIRLPAQCSFRVSQIRFAQNFDARLVKPEFRDHRVLTTGRQASVKQLDHKINIRQDAGHLANRLVHVTWVPVNCHKKKCALLVTSRKYAIGFDNNDVCRQVNVFAHKVEIEIRNSRNARSEIKAIVNFTPSSFIRRPVMLRCANMATYVFSVNAVWLKKEALPDETNTY